MNKKKVLKNIYDKNKIAASILGVFTIVLIIYILVNSFSNDDNQTKSSKKFETISISNNIKADEICKIGYYKKDDVSYDLRFCYNGEVKIYDYSADSKMDLCNENFVIPTLNIKNIVDVIFIDNHMIESNVLYALTKNGKVYSLSLNNLLSKTFIAKEEVKLKNIVDFEKLEVYFKEKPMYVTNYYAIDSNGDIHELAK